MLVRFSVSTMGGLEIFSYEVEKFKEVATDPMLVSGFMSPIKWIYLIRKFLELGKFLI